MVSIQVSTSPGYSVNNNYVNTSQRNAPHNIVHNIVVENDQSLIKGLLWGFVGFKFGTATLGCLGATVATSPLILTPLLAMPVGLGVATYALGSITGSCIDNAMYHLGSRQVRVLQVS